VTSSAETPRITQAMKANWAIAYAACRRSDWLNPALRKAYGKEAFAVPRDVGELREAFRAARSIHAALGEALRLLGEAEPE
jgi:hypothetical protein